MIINAGSGPIAYSGKGWTNTHAHAAIKAQEWSQQMFTDGFRDIEVVDTGEEVEGKWVFTYRHTVTDVTVRLEIDGIDDLEAFQSERIFSPRTYWNGSSCATPTVEDFAAPGFAPVITWAPGTPVRGQPAGDGPVSGGPETLPQAMRRTADVMDQANARFNAENPMSGYSANEPISASSMRFLADLWEIADGAVSV